jgi:triacylglycerol lipase
MRTIAVCLLFGLFACTPADDSDSESSETGGGDYKSYTATHHPIVLVHGLLGFDDLFGVEEYFHGIPEALAQGGAEVYVVTASQAHRPEVRGEQIIPQLEEILDATGAEKLNLIGHSAGALDARYVAAVRPDLVASVTSVGGPHQGTPLADTILSDTLGPLDNVFLQGVADLIKLVSGSEHPNDADAALGAMTTAGAAAFNAAYPAAVAIGCGEGEPVVDGIHYYSWGGTGTITNPLDLGDPMLLMTSLMIPGPSDGLVPRCSTHLGEVIRDDYRQNHMDQTNLLFAMVSPLGPRPTALYRQHANRLRNAGL